MSKVTLTLQEYNKLILSAEKNKTIAMDTIEENLKLCKEIEELKIRRIKTKRNRITGTDN